MTVVELTESEFKNVVTSNDVVVIDFWAPWCAPCKAMEPVFTSLSEKFAGEAFFGRVNVNEEPSLATSFEIFIVPTFVILVKGKVYKRIAGITSPARLEEAVREAVRAAR